MMLTRLQSLFRAFFAFAFLCLLSTPVFARAPRPAARPVFHPRVAAPVKKGRKPAPVVSSRHGRALARPVERKAAWKEIRSTRMVRGRKLPRVAAVPEKRHGLVRRVLAAVASKPLPAAPPVSVVMTPEAERDTEGAENIRDVYLAHRQPSSPVTPEPVVSIIRPTTERPQLPSPQEVAAMPEILPSLYDKRGRLVMPAPLRGSHEILVHQNEMADRDGLARVQDDGDLDEMRRRAMLVAVPVSGGMQVDERLPANRRYCRPWTANFLAALSRAHYARFHTALQVNSAVRTVAVQQRLLRTNGNAAPAGGETASPHLTGQAVDIGKRGLSLSEIAWMRGYLLPLVQDGKIDVEEEFQQSCFHISVYKKYLPVLDEIAVTHRDRPAALAIMLH